MGSRRQIAVRRAHGGGAHRPGRSCRGLALAGGRRADGGDQDQFSLWPLSHRLGGKIQCDFPLGRAVAETVTSKGCRVCRRFAHRPQAGGLGNGDITLGVNGPEHEICLARRGVRHKVRSPCFAFGPDDILRGISCAGQIFAPRLIVVNARAPISCVDGRLLDKEGYMAEDVSDPTERVPGGVSLLYAAPQFLAPDVTFAPLVEAVTIMTEAQMAYGRAVFCANAALFGGLAGRVAPETDDRPSVAARLPRFSQG